MAHFYPATSDCRLADSGEGRRAAVVLRTVEVDLTPVLPGGDNGGAKTFALELLGRLIHLKPDCRFILMTSEVAHSELAVLDAPNAERRCVRTEGPLQRRGLQQSMLTPVLAWMPHRFRRGLARRASDLRQVMVRWFRRPVLSESMPDLLFCPFTATTYLRTGVPVVSTLHDLQFQTYSQFFSPEEQAHREAVFRATCRDASHIVAISEHTRSAVIATGLVEPERVRVIPHRLASRCAQHQVLDGILDDPRRPYLIYPANFWRHKNHELLLAGFGMATRAGLPGNMRLVFTGMPGERQEKLMALCEAMGLGSKVFFAGHLPDPAFAAALRSATALVFPSLFEGFGMPVLEAMALGVPVASSSLTALPEVCGNAALLFDPRIPEEISRALVSIATDQPLRERLMAEGVRRAREFVDSDAMALDYWRVFEEAVAKGAIHNRLHGVHHDGWLASRASVELSLPRGAGKADLVLELEAPAWLPSPGPTLTASCIGRPQASKILEPGTLCEWRIRSPGGRVDLAISPTFVPSRIGVARDDRELTVLLRRCRVEYSDGTRSRVLWPMTEP